MRLFRRSDAATLALALSLAATAMPVRAQYAIVQAPTPDADALAAEMRLLAANPGDVEALVRAGELTLKLDDATAASGFFARAERLDPRNPRIKAGLGTLLVQGGRPGEALRRFAEAESFRGDVRLFVADRGLAYDLIGEQERAQRDYRLALKNGPADETIRRYALSLGISGRRDEALSQLDPLLRRSDRAAWRARAFILAMTGDTNGAERIATSMMPGGLAQGLEPFFQRLPQLSAVDRAFAVHFGEVRGSVQRMQDARLAPPLPALQPEPGRPVVMASTVKPPVPVVEKKDRRDRKRDRKDKSGNDPVRLATATTTPPVPLPAPPAYVGPPVSREIVQEIPGRTEVVRATPSRAGGELPPVTLASARPVTITAVPAPRRDMAPIPSVARPVVEESKPVVASAPVVTKLPTSPAPVMDGSGSDTAEEGPDVLENPSTTQFAPAAVTAPHVIVAVSPVDRPMPAPVQSAPSSKPVSAPPAQQPVATVTSELHPPGAARGEDSILSKIIANITVPGSELGVDPVQAPPEPNPVPEVAPIKLAEAPPARVEPKPLTTAKPAPDDAAIQAKAIVDQKAAEKKASDKKLADKKLADKKLADKKLADAKKAEELKKKNDPKILEPSRIWVQVAGGANEASLAKEWARVRDKSPAAFKGKSGWTTPLRLTNRVLTGPFKTNEEARAFVNLIAKSDISGFTFTSEAGQKVTKLGGK
ncbi:SPOR domain-containing protein [Sphingomonas sp. ERG5]|uniref:SPOR domain-containing protein n=1 Tax=Sphingomonas sp. ERG5 TaxID=1381597 RepID=UPI00054B5525|nr:tetratricopeptide repeat protein [Sphingomonas sp. ERG5]